MAKLQPARATVRLRGDRQGTDLAGFLDMLRYDGATVVSWDRVDGDAFLVTLQSRVDGYGFTNDRWASFGLYLKEVAS